MRVRPGGHLTRPLTGKAWEGGFRGVIEWDAKVSEGVRYLRERSRREWENVMLTIPSAELGGDRSAVEGAERWVWWWEREREV